MYRIIFVLTSVIITSSSYAVNCSSSVGNPANPGTSIETRWACRGACGTTPGSCALVSESNSGVVVNFLPPQSQSGVKPNSKH